MEFKDLAELERHLNKMMTSVLNEEVAQVVKNKEQEKVITDVYDKYQPNNGEPFVYKRRGWNGGLADQRNMESKVKTTVNGVELSVENVTKGKVDPSINVAGLVEYGDNNGYGEYDYKTNRDGTAYQYLNPRPFQEEAVLELEKSGEHIDAFVRGMKRQGIDIK